MASIGQLSKGTQITLLGILILILCVIFYFYMISPVRNEVKTLEAEIQTLEKEVEQGQAVQLQLAQLKKAVADQAARLAALRRTLPDQKETADIIRQVQQLAERSNLKIKSFTPRATINNVFYEEWPILISMEGNYHSVGSFFEKVGRFARIINVGDIAIQSLEKGVTGDRTLSATCTATTFVFVENPQVEEGASS